MQYKKKKAGKQMLSMMLGLSMILTSVPLAAQETELTHTYGETASVETESVTARSNEAETEAVTEQQTEPATEAATEQATEPATEAATEQSTEAGTEHTTEQMTEPVTESGTEAATEQMTESVTESETEQTTELQTESETGSVMTLSDESTVAMIGETPYASLQGAISAAKSGDTIILTIDQTIASVGSTGSEASENVTVTLPAGVNLTIAENVHVTVAEGITFVIPDNTTCTVSANAILELQTDCILSSGEGAVLKNSGTIHFPLPSAYQAAAYVEEGDSAFLRIGAVAGEVAWEPALIFENTLYFDGGDLTNTGLDSFWENKPAYYKAGDGYVILENNSGLAVLYLNNATIGGQITGGCTLEYIGENIINSEEEGILSKGDGNQIILKAKDNFSCLKISSKDNCVYGTELIVSNGTLVLNSNDNSAISVEVLTIKDSANVTVSMEKGIWQGAVYAMSEVFLAENCTLTVNAAPVSSGITLGLNAYNITLQGTFNGFTLEQMLEDEETFYMDLIAYGKTELNTNMEFARWWLAASGGDTILDGIQGDILEALQKKLEQLNSKTDENEYNECERIISFLTDYLSITKLIIPSDSVLTIPEGRTLDLSNLPGENIQILGKIVNNGTIILPKNNPGGIIGRTNIENYGTVKCSVHTYSGDCDKTCNICGNSRDTDVEHTYPHSCDTACSVCGEPRTAAGPHTYSGSTTTAFSWSEDNTSCTLTLTCDANNTHTETFTCTVTEDRSVSGKITYTASATVNGISFTEQKTVDKVVIEVDISWGNLAFTYSDESAGWTTDSENGNEITIENKSNVAMNASVTFDTRNDYSFGGSWETENISESGSDGSGSDQTVDDSSAGETALQAESQNAGLNTAQADLAQSDGKATFALQLSGTPTGALQNAEIGVVTITIQEKETE